MRAAVLLSIAAVAACTADAPPAPPEPPPAGPASVAGAAPLPAEEVPYFVLGGSPPRPGSRRPPRDSLAQRRWADSMFAAMRERVGDMEAVQGADDWREADAAATRAATAWGDGAVPHGLAVDMLDHHLLRGPLDADKAEALGRYTQVLLDAGSQEGALVLWALLRLDGRWDDAQRRSAARLTADRLGAAYAARAGCVGCTTREALDAMWPEQRRSLRPILEDIEVVHRELRKLAAGDTPGPGR